MPLQGLTQGAQPIIGYNYGAKKYVRVRKTYKWSIIASTLFITAGFILIQLFPGFFISLFRNEEGPLMDMGIYCLRVSSALFPVVGFQMFSSSYFQAIGKPVEGSVLSLSRQILIYIPLLLFLPNYFKLDGVFFAMPAADLLATVLTAAIMFFEL
jgi:Na+-driven multidrug efflux pump